MTTPLVWSLGIIAPTLSVLVCVAQAVRILRSGAQGVSLGTWVLSTFVAEMWTSYGFVFHVPAELYCNIPFLSVSTIVIGSAARHQDKVRQTVLRCVGVTLLTLALSLLGMTHWRFVIATIAVCGAIFIYLPQMVTALRSTELHGVSGVSWFIAFTTSLCWAAYGILIHKLPVAYPAIVMAPASLIIVVQVVRHRRSVTTSLPA